MQHTPRYYPPKAPLWQALIYLGLLCALFYAALNYYSGNALSSIDDIQLLPVDGPRMSAAALQRLLALRAAFTVLFCLLLGFMGHRVTGKLWPAPLVHAVAAGIMLWQEVPQAILLDNIPLALGLMAVVGVLTLAGSAGTAWRAKNRGARSGVRFGSGK